MSTPDSLANIEELLNDVSSQTGGTEVDDTTLLTPVPVSFVLDDEPEDPRPEENSYHCSICHNVMYRPVTLICQHSYVLLCLQ